MTTTITGVLRASTAVLSGVAIRFCAIATVMATRSVGTLRCTGFTAMVEMIATGGTKGGNIVEHTDATRMMVMRESRGDEHNEAYAKEHVGYPLFLFHKSSIPLSAGKVMEFFCLVKEIQ